MLTNEKPTQLSTSLKEPLFHLEKHFLANCDKIEKWFAQKWKETTPPVYGSVDLRNAGFKLAPIDMNLFPAGFNNLNPDYLAHSVEAARETIADLQADAKNILIIPESHTRNLFYWENIYALQSIIQQAGFNTRIGFISDEITEARIMELPSGNSVTIEPLQRQGDELQVDGFKADLLLLNNDMSAGIPEVLQGVKQPIIPPAELGWSNRLKSWHFQYYAKVAEEFAQLVDIDPWLIAPYFRHCGKIDFKQKEGLDCLIKNGERLFADLEKKYKEYNIPHKPFLVVKSDAGTYGMAVMTVRSVEDIKNLNRKQRTKMAASKGGQPVSRVIIQEGVHTFETTPDGAVAEPVVYLFGKHVIGGFYRLHKDRAIDESLNAPGMQFSPIAFPKPCNEPCADKDPDSCQNRYYTYGIIAKLSMLAAAFEKRDQVK